MGIVEHSDNHVLLGEIRVVMLLCFDWGKKGFIKLLYGMIYTRLDKQGLPIDLEV